MCFAQKRDENNILCKKIEDQTFTESLLLYDALMVRLQISCVWAQELLETFVAANRHLLQ